MQKKMFSFLELGRIIRINLTKNSNSREVHTANLIVSDSPRDKEKLKNCFFLLSFIIL